jgi:hypothetical protein
VTNTSTQSSPFCKLCIKPGHFTDDCQRWEKKCTNCNIIGHDESECRYEKIVRKLKSRKHFNPGCGGKRRRTEREKALQSEETAHIEEEEIVFVSTEHNEEDFFEGAEYYNFDTDVDSYENDECLIYYECLADSAMTSHVSNRHDAFISYKPTENILMGGVGGIKTQAKGRGTVILESTYKGHKYTLMLKDILYIPRNKNNLISLGKWEAMGSMFEAHKGKLMLTSESRKGVAMGTRT